MVRTELYTAGGEFVLPDGTEYIGAYHIHARRGAMVGGFHKTEAHDLLRPTNRRVESFVQSIMRGLLDENNQEQGVRRFYS